LLTAPLHLWTDNSHELLSQKLQKKRKMLLTSSKVYHHSTISQASVLDRCCNRGNDITYVGCLRSWYRLGPARYRAAYCWRTSSQIGQGYHHRGCVLKYTTSSGRWREVKPTVKETFSFASQCSRRVITDRVPLSLSLSSFLPMSMVTTTGAFVVQNGNSSCGEPVIHDDVFLLPGSYVQGLQMTTSSR